MFTISRYLCAVIAAGLAAPALGQVEYTLTYLGQPPGDIYTVEPRGLNNLGEVVGWVHNSADTPQTRAWKWTAATGMVLLPPTGRGYYAPVDINDAGQIAGDSGTSYADVAWRFEDGVYTFLPLPPGGTWSTLGHINAAGDVVGYSGDFSPPGGDLFFYSDSTGLSIIPNPTGTAGIGRMNDLRQVAASLATDAALWSPTGGFQTIGDPPGLTCTGASAVNNNGEIAATSRLSCHSREDRIVFLYSNGTWLQIVNLALATYGESAAAINNNAVVVGSSNLLPQTAWVWSRERGVRLLHDTIDRTGLPPSFHLYAAVDINDAGQILARGNSLTTDVHAAYLLTPIGGAACDPDYTCDGNADQEDVACMINTVAGNGGCGCQDPDFNRDGNVDQDDVAAVINAVAGGPCP